jgi:hypothetical protein
LRQKGGSFGQRFEALMPNGIFRSDKATDTTTMSRDEASPAQEFLKLNMFLVSNNFFGATSDVNRKVYKWLKRRSDAGFMESLVTQQPYCRGSH